LKISGDYTLFRKIKAETKMFPLFTDKTCHYQPFELQNRPVFLQFNYRLALIFVPADKAVFLPDNFKVNLAPDFRVSDYPIAFVCLLPVTFFPCYHSLTYLISSRP
jgi:hypothetical protein